MEKDHFKDRPIESTQISKIRIGMEVLICEKAMQKSASNLDDLTYGKVCRVLTRRDHPRGIKVEIMTMDGRSAIGRIVYLIS